MNPLIIHCSDYLKKNLDSEVQRVTEQNFKLPVYINANYHLDMIHLQNLENPIKQYRDNNGYLGSDKIGCNFYFRKHYPKESTVLVTK